MSEAEQTKSSGGSAIQLNGLLAFKVGMTSVYSETGEAVPVTVLKYEPCVVSQVKTVEKDGYSGVQIACRPQKAKNSSKAQSTHLKKSGFENGAQVVRELPGPVSADVQVGAAVSIDSLKAGDVVKLMGYSKGKGFAGSVRRWNFAGGPAAHGSKFHRKPGSSGNRTWPGRVMPGKRFPGHWGNERVSVKNVQVVRVLADENLVLVKGPVPGARNSLVSLVKG